jgi:hypothetical protein
MKTKNTKTNDPSYFKNVVHMNAEEGPLCRATAGHLGNTEASAVNCNKCRKVMKEGRK